MPPSLRASQKINSDLVKAPAHCIDYAILRELCHLKTPRHSTAFYRRLACCMPDWESRKRRLEKVPV